ncbi:hypothetical protein U6A24_20995 [Aquimarina gracilis]|uniref:Natural product n=1 Tax=Aquimarina gracilis TaxID=874422 RepID=A0ABU6A1C7_9FLAO|nr:hypothetical protein [Aquimarina gracilis]MEB3347965.1 hypothetical protein [Aquimarina gracilis]
MKKILKLKGVQKLSREQQSTIKGALINYGCCSDYQCRVGYWWSPTSTCEYSPCINGVCSYLY